jgi:hypothetical protein
VVRSGRHSPHSLPARAILFRALGSYRSLPFPEPLGRTVRYLTHWTRTVRYPHSTLGVEPFGIWRLHSSPGLVGDQPTRAARGPSGAEWRGQGARACPTSPTGLSDAP